jgi:hypothetical protein
MAAASLDAEPDLGLRLPKLCPYDWEAVTTRDVMAEAGFPLSGGDDLTSKPRPGKGKT